MSPACFRVLWPEVGLEGTMKHMAGRKRHSAEDIMHKLRRADELVPRARPVNSQRGGATPDLCLGPVEDVAHEGDRPVAITWCLQQALR